MKITLLGHRDIASLYSLNRIVRGASAHDCCVFLSGPLRSGVNSPDALLQLAQSDEKLCAEFLRHNETSARLCNAPDLAAPNRDHGLTALRATKPDLIVSIRYRRILKKAAIAIPHYGVLNLHSGILPDYRGVMATFWAMLNGECEIGSTMHWITDAGIDTGPVLSVQRQPTRPDESYLANVLRLYDSGCDSILAALATISSGTMPESYEQAGHSGRYFSTPDKTDLSDFLARGLLLVDGSERKYVNFPDSSD